MHLTDQQIISSILAVIDFAKTLSIDQLTLRRNTQTYPDTIGEHITSYCLGLLLSHEWQSESNEDGVDAILSLLSLLDTGVDRPETWQELFEEADKFTAIDLGR